MLNSTNWYRMFYWITRADTVKEFFDFTSNAFTAASVVLFAALIITKIISATDYSERIRTQATTVYKFFRGFFFISVVLAVISWMGYIFIPSKKDCLLILAGGGAVKFLTTDSSARQIPKELTTFVVAELRSAAESAKVQWESKDIKDKILEQAKGMTKDELLQKMQADSNFARVILNK